MNILYYDCFAGISGDMNLGALIDLGVPENYLKEELQKLNIDGYHIEIEKTLKMGISGTKVHVHLTEHAHDHPHNHHHEHEHRNLSDIKSIIGKSSLNSFVKEKSIAIFSIIAEAEAKIHNKSIETIHFHEVGAVDSIVDAVGAAICIDYLKPEKILASPVELGGGFVKCAHGTFPVPAPATAEILKNIPVKLGNADKETTTPTGAAILKVFVDEFVCRTELTIVKTAYGIGHRDLEIPNVLRVINCHEKNENAKTAEALMVECNIDDMNPEHYDYLIEKLFAHGAHDVFMVPIIMKKSRPAVQLKILCDNSNKEKIENTLLTHSTSIGLRYFPLTKTMLDRQTNSIGTKYGDIRIKEAFSNGKLIKYKAEYEDCVEAARKNSVSLQEIGLEVDRCVFNKK